MIRSVMNNEPLNDMMDVIGSATSREFKEGTITKADMERFLSILCKVMWTWTNNKYEYRPHSVKNTNAGKNYDSMLFLFENFAKDLHDMFAHIWGLESYDIKYKRIRAAIEEVLDNPKTGEDGFKRIEDLIKANSSK